MLIAERNTTKVYKGEKKCLANSSQARAKHKKNEYELNLVSITHKSRPSSSS
jgi:hypothetical protein